MQKEIDEYTALLKIIDKADFMVSEIKKRKGKFYDDAQKKLSELKRNPNPDLKFVDNKKRKNLPDPVIQKKKQEMVFQVGSDGHLSCLDCGFRNCRKVKMMEGILERAQEKSEERIIQKIKEQDDQ